MSTAHAGRLARWALKMQVHVFGIEYRSGARHANVDAMSRPPFAARTPALSFPLRRAPEQAPPSPARITYADADAIPLFDTDNSEDTAEDAANAAQDAAQILSLRSLGEET